MAQRTYFQQEEPRLGNQYLEDSALVSILKVKVPKEILDQVEPDFIQFGDRVVDDILQYGFAVEDNPPKLKNFNAWGRRVDEIVVDDAWNKLHDISAQEGLIAAGYERKYGHWSRLFQYIKLYMFQTSSGVYTCPLAMTDGAARLIEVHGGSVKNPAERERLKRAYQHLTSRIPEEFWTSGQWMTEKTGGSDVQISETTARFDATENVYKLTGFKFFTSATTSQMAITLARVHPNQPLSAFYLETHDAQGQLNGITIHRLKNKLGTRAVPTAELELKDTRAILIGKEGEGVKVISVLFNITRIFNACGSCAGMRRGIALARDFSSRRSAFGRTLMDNPLHLATIANMEVEFRACLIFLVDVLIKFGKSESNTATENELILLRVLTPLLKLYSGKKGVQMASEAVESLGGTGYMEDSHIPLLLRNSQVESIWEGTTNVLSHDIWRPIRKQNSLPIFGAEVRRLIATAKNPKFSKLQNSVTSALAKLIEFATRVGGSDSPQLEANMRDFAFSMARIYACALMVEFAATTGADIDFVAATKFCNAGLYLVDEQEGAEQAENNRKLALDVDKTGKPCGIGDFDGRGKLRAKY